MTIEQEQKCAIEALSRASDVTQRLMFREGAKWMDSEHAAALAIAEERCRELEYALKNLSDECLIIAEALNDYPPCTQPSMSRNDASRNLKQWVCDVRAALEGK